MKSELSKNYNRFQYVIYCLLIFLPVYQDSPLVDVLGSAGVSLMPVFSMLCIVLVLISRHKVTLNKYIKIWLKLGVMLLLVSYAALFIWLITGNPITMYQEWLPAKAIKIILQYFSYIAYVIVVLMLMHGLSAKKIFTPIYFTLLILTVICIIELIEAPNAFKFLHYSGIFPYWRVRLLTKESSWTAVMILNYSVLSLFYGLEYKKRFITITSLVCAGVLLVSSESKSLLGIVAVGIVIYLFYNLKKLNIKSLILSFAVILLLIIYMQTGVKRFNELTIGDIENYTSFATRSFTIIVGIIMGLIYPLGVGGSVFVGLFTQYIQNLIHYIPSWLNVSEIYLYLNNSSDDGLSIKSGLFQYHVYWGIVGTVLMLMTLFGINKQVRISSIKMKNLLSVVLICNLIMLAFTTSFTYEFWMLLAIIMGVVKQNQTETEEQNLYLINLDSV